MRIMGIDPGRKGAICLLSELEPPLFWTMEAWELCSLFNKTEFVCSADHVYVEKAQTYPGEGSVGAFKYGMGFGKLLGFFEALGQGYTLVAPQTWTKIMHKGATGSTAKEKSLQVVKRLFPKQDLILPRCRKPHDGMVDSLLIAEYGRRIFK